MQTFDRIRRADRFPLAFREACEGEELVTRQATSSPSARTSLYMSRSRQLLISVVLTLLLWLVNW
jgi:hypothetical protein